MSIKLTGLSRALLTLNAAIAWLAVAISFALMAVGYYKNDIDPAYPTIVGNQLDGKDQVWERFFDWSGYFTILSNIVVAVVLTVLLRKPELFTSEDARGRWWRALRLDSVVMIAITGIVYNLLLAEGGKTGWDFVSDSLQHDINPLLTVAVWFVAGPRGLMRPSTIAYAMALPLGWAVYAIGRGSFIGAYPYSFLDVATQGITFVVMFVLMILTFAVLLSLLLLGSDRLLARRGAPRG